MTNPLPAKVLIVDDDDSLRRIYARYLASEGFEVVEAGTLEEASQPHPGKKFDVILLDIRMHATDGSLLLPLLRHHYPHTKIIVSSCYTVEMQKEMVENAADYFDKAHGCRALLVKIQEVLKPSGVKIKAL